MWKKKLYIKNNLDPYPLSRTKVDLFNDCRKCFYNDIVHGIKRPLGPPLVINNAIDQVLKKEIETFRVEQRKHPLLAKLNEDFVPAMHDKLNDWKNSFKGIRYVHKECNLELFGSLDDLWFNRKNKSYSVVSYKYTSKKETLTEEHIPHSYWKQLSFYNYLLKKNNINVSNKNYIVYVNGIKNTDKFENKLNFEIKIFNSKANLDWIDEAVTKIYKILQSDNHPAPSQYCKYCQYVGLVNLKK